MCFAMFCDKMIKQTIFCSYIMITKSILLVSFFLPTISVFLSNIIGQLRVENVNFELLDVDDIRESWVNELMKLVTT